MYVIFLGGEPAARLSYLQLMIMEMLDFIQGSLENIWIVMD